MTYLEIVNRVLRRLRENEVSSVQETPYSKLVGDLVNVVKREVEDAWDWGALRTTLSATTSSSLFNYVLTGSTSRIRIIEVINDTSNFFMQQKSTKWFDQQFLVTGASAQTGSPVYYNFNGIDSNGDSQVDFFPIPDGTYDIRINCVIPQAELSANTDIIQVPALLVIEGAIARAISERGDDGGYQEQETRYRNMASDYIAIESAQRLDEITWRPC
jgi:hypothetical protein